MICGLTADSPQVVQVPADRRLIALKQLTAQLPRKQPGAPRLFLLYHIRIGHETNHYLKLF